MSSAEVRRQYSQVFDDVAKAYDDVRPSYPPALVDAAIERGGLRAGSRVLEVGSGTGKLTELLAARGLEIDAVDPGPNMIEAARQRVGDTDRVRFHVGTFEDVRFPESAFAALFSATAFHWVEPQIGWRKAAAVLEPGGLLALLAHRGLHDEESAAAEEGFRALLREHAPEISEDLPPSLDLATILAGVEQRRDNASAVWDWLMGENHGLAVADAADLFDDVDVETVVTPLVQTAEQLRDHFRTTSLYFRIDPAHRPTVEDADQRLVESLGGSVRFSQAAMLMTARRR